MATKNSTEEPEPVQPVDPEPVEPVDPEPTEPTPDDEPVTPAEDQERRIKRAEENLAASHSR